MPEKPLVAKRKRTPRTEKQKIWYYQYQKDWFAGINRRTAHIDTPEIIENRRIERAKSRTVKYLKERQLASYRMSTRKHNLEKKYNLTIEQYDEMEKLQNGVCAICFRVSRRNNKTGKQEKLCVDHDHITGKVRGLLCSGCNKALGHFNDSIEMLSGATEYLRKHSN